VFGTTFLGHQGWMFQTDKARILVDPLLCEDFGAIHALGYRVWPPRAWRLDQLSPIDAVFYSHEHDDHFDIPSIARLSRDIPIYLSSRSSSAAITILAQMGFSVRPLVPGVSVAIADLEVIPFTGDHVTVNCGDEWDTLPYLVRHTGGDGSMFTMVDITMTQAHVEWAAARVARPGIVGWTNNALDWSHMAGYLNERVEGTQQSFVKMGMGHKLIEQGWGAPVAMVMCAGGFAFEGDRAWLNQRVFCVDAPSVCAQMAAVYKKERFLAGVPGQTLWMQNRKLVRVDDTAPFLAAQPRDAWPARAKLAAPGAPPDYTPATGRRELAPGELDRLRAGLADLAGALFGGSLFRSLCSLLASEALELGRRPTFAFALRDGDARHVFAYAPNLCAFEPGEPAAETAYLAGLECWAADLAAVLAGELGPIALTFGRARLWNALPARFRFDILSNLYSVSHPLRRPDATLRSYQRRWEAARATQPVIGGRGIT
jgi:hypothetical protein